VVPLPTEWGGPEEVGMSSEKLEKKKEGWIGWIVPWILSLELRKGRRPSGHKSEERRG